MDAGQQNTAVFQSACPKMMFSVSEQSKTLYRLAAVFCAVMVRPTVAAQPAADQQPLGVQICRLNLKTQTTQILFDLPKFRSVRRPDICAVNGRVIFSGRHSDRPTDDDRIYVCRTDGTELQDLGRGTQPSWSPGGNRIAFSRSGPESGVWIMQSDGSQQRLLDQFGRSAVWSSSGRLIAYIRTTDGQDTIVVYDLVEDLYRIVADRTAGFETLVSAPEWTAADTRLCFVSTLQDDTVLCSVAVTGKPDLQIHYRSAQKPAADTVCFTTTGFVLSSSSPDRELKHLLPAGESTSDPVPGQPTDRINTSAVSGPSEDEIIFVSHPLQPK